MGNLTTMDYAYAAGGAGLAYYGLKHAHGWVKYAVLAAAAYAFYTVYTDY